MASRLVLAAMAAVLGAVPALAETLVVVPNRVIYPGQTITSDALDLVPLRRKLSDPSGVLYDREEAVGQIASRTLLPGRMIPVGSMRQAYLVEPGKPVEVRFVQGGLQISITGVSLQSGAAGEMIRVRNADTGVVFSGIVMADGSVRVSAS